MAKALLHFNTKLQKGIFISLSFPYFLSSFQSQPIISYILLSFYHNTHFLSDDDKSEPGYLNPGGKDCNFDYRSSSSRFDTLLQIRPTPPISAFASILNPLFKMKQYSTFIALSRKLDYARVPRDFYMINMIIQCYCQLGHARLGLSVLGKLLKLGYRPNNVTFTNLILGLSQDDGNVGDAFALFREAVDQGWQMSAPTYATLINRLCKVGRVDEGLKLLRMMRLAGIEPNESYNNVIDGLCKKKLMSEARQLFSEMINKGIIPTTIAYNTLIWGYCNIGELREAEHIIDLMTDAGCSPDVFTYNTLINGYCKQGLMEKAQVIVKTMIAKGFTPDVFTYNILINGFCELRRTDAVMALLEVMSQKGLSPNIVTYNSLIDMLCKEGKIKEVENIMKMMTDKKQYPDTVTYTTLIQAYCRNGVMDKAQEIFETMISKGCAHDVFTYNTLINGYCKLRRRGDVIALLKEMSQKGLSPDSFTYDSLIGMLAMDGKTKDVENIMKLMIDKKKDPNTVGVTSLVESIVNHLQCRDL